MNGIVDAGGRFGLRSVDRNSREKPFSFVILFLWVKVDGKWVSAGDAYVVGSFPKQVGGGNDPK